MSFPLKSLRVDALRKLGFDPFFDNMLGDRVNLLAIMLPPAYYNCSESKEFVKWLMLFIEQTGWRCKICLWLDHETYNTNWCGSRCHTHILGPHVQIEVEHNVEEPREMPELPAIPTFPSNWITMHIEYDALKKPESRIAYNMYSYEAAFPADAQTTYERLVYEAKQYMGTNAA